MSKGKKVSKKKTSKKKTSKKNTSKNKHYNKEVNGYNLSESEFMKWKLLESEAKVAELERNMSIVILNGIKSKIPELLKAEGDVSKKNNDFSKKRKEFMLYIEEMCAKFNLDPKNIIIDDELGILRDGSFLENKE